MKKVLALTVAMAVCCSAAALACDKDNATKTSYSAASAGTGGCTEKFEQTSTKYEHTTFAVTGMNSTKAARRVRLALAKLTGVNDVQCDPSTCTATVCWKGCNSNASASARLNSMGYKSAIVTADMNGAKMSGAAGGSCPYSKSSAASGACPHGSNAKASATKDKTL